LSSPIDVYAINQFIHCLTGIVSGCGGQVGVANRGENGDMAKDFLYLDKIHTSFKEMGGETVAQGMAGNFFLCRSV
jgi:hypothetical protein